MIVYGIDFFCGVGGATKGFQDAGVQVLKGIDNDVSCKKTYEENCAPAKFVLKDINNVGIEDRLLDVNPSKDDYLLYIACAPCQPFSRFAKLRSCKAQDRRTYLMGSFIKIIGEDHPDFVFVENVPGFAEALNGTLLGQFCQVFDHLGYNYEWRIVDARDYGTPQKRLRFVFFASKVSKMPFPAPTYGGGRHPYITVREAIGKYPPIAAGEAHPNLLNHQSAKLSRLNLRRLKHTPKNGGSRKDWPHHLWLKCHEDDSSHTDVYGRMKWDEPAPTLTCRCISVSNGRFAHPEQDRAISVREAASLQTFPEKFVFYERMAQAAKHIGNAVPPILAFEFGKVIIDIAKQEGGAS